MLIVVSGVDDVENLNIIYLNNNNLLKYYKCI